MKPPQIGDLFHWRTTGRTSRCSVFLCVGHDRSIRIQPVGRIERSWEDGIVDKSAFTMEAVGRFVVGWDDERWHEDHA